MTSVVADRAAQGGGGARVAQGRARQRSHERPHIDDYFGRQTSKMVIRQALEVMEQKGKLDVMVNVVGGGLSGQAGAIRHGIVARSCASTPSSARR